MIYYIRHIEEYCEGLTAVNEFETDTLLRVLLQSESLTGRVSDTFNFNDTSRSSVRGQTAVSMVADGFMLEVDLIRKLPGLERLSKAGTHDLIFLCSPRASTKKLASWSCLSMELRYLESYIRELALHHPLWEGVLSSVEHCAGDPINRAFDTSLLSVNSATSPARNTMIEQLINSDRALLH